MNQDQEISFEIYEFPIIQLIQYALLICWLGFAAFMFDVNPGFFTGSVILAICFILWISRKRIMIKNGILVRRSIRLISLFSTDQEFSIQDLRAFEYKRGKFDALRFFLILADSIPLIIKDESVFILKFKDDTQLEFKAIGTEQENARLSELINAYISQSIGER